MTRVVNEMSGSEDVFMERTRNHGFPQGKRAIERGK
jgi:hypothetical protein